MIKFPLLNANSVDPDLMLHSVASSLFANYLLGGFKTKCAKYQDKDQMIGVFFSWPNKDTIIALDKELFSTKKYLYFSYFTTKTYVVGTH